MIECVLTNVTHCRRLCRDSLVDEFLIQRLLIPRNYQLQSSSLLEMTGDLPRNHDAALLWLLDRIIQHGDTCIQYLNGRYMIEQLFKKLEQQYNDQIQQSSDIYAILSRVMYLPEYLDYFFCESETITDSVKYMKYGVKAFGSDDRVMLQSMFSFFAKLFSDPPTRVLEMMRRRSLSIFRVQDPEQVLGDVLKCINDLKSMKALNAEILSAISEIICSLYRSSSESIQLRGESFEIVASICLDAVSESPFPSSSEASLIFNLLAVCMQQNKTIVTRIVLPSLVDLICRGISAEKLETLNESLPLTLRRECTKALHNVLAAGPLYANMVVSAGCLKVYPSIFQALRSSFDSDTEILREDFYNWIYQMFKLLISILKCESDMILKELSKMRPHFAEMALVTANALSTQMCNGTLQDVRLK